MMRVSLPVFVRRPLAPPTAEPPAARVAAARGAARVPIPARALGALATALLLLAAAPAARAQTSDTPTRVALVPWGAGFGELTRRGGDETFAPEGPMSFAVDARGGVSILDQARLGILHLDAQGRPVRRTPLPADTYQDFALLPDGAVVALDRLARRSLDTFGPKGALRTAVPVESASLPEGGGITALFQRPDGLWLEYDHTTSIRVAEPDGRPAFPRVVVRGRPAGPTGERRLHARRAAPNAVEVWTVGRTDDVIHGHRTLTFADPVFRIVELLADAKGRVVLITHTLREGPPPAYPVLAETFDIRVFSPDLTTELRQLRAAPGVGAFEQFREFVLTDSGVLYQLRFTETGAEVLRWQL